MSGFIVLALVIVGAVMAYFVGPVWALVTVSGLIVLGLVGAMVLATINGRRRTR